MTMTTIGSRATRAAYSALISQRSLVSGRFVGNTSTPAKAAQPTRHISKTSAPKFCASSAAHPEDRLTAARRKARAAHGLPDKDSADVAKGSAQTVPVSAKPHPEDRLKAARRKMLESMGLTVDGDGNVVESRATTSTLASVGTNDAHGNGESAPLPICAQNNHPDHRLRVARERMLAKVKGDAGVGTGTGITSGGSVNSPKSVRIDLEMSPDRRLRLARTEQAAKPIQTFKPMKRKRRRLKTGALLSRLTCSTEQPPLLRNDGYSSGSVAAMRLREARHEAIERLLVSSTPADASVAAAAAAAAASSSSSLTTSSSREEKDTK